MPEFISSRKLANDLMPSWKPEEWFHWPPDVFAFTSILLETTGVYRYAVSPHHETGTRLLGNRTSSETFDRLNNITTNWYRWLLGINDAFPPELATCRQKLFESEVELSSDPLAVDYNTAECLLDLHVMADFSSANLGLLTATTTGLMSGVSFLANYLLAVTGSLSRLPRHHGVVLPKMRTPQRGLTVRSFSHHLTFHRSEARVLWRSIPWTDAGKTNKTVNIVAVPTPYEVTLDSFRPSSVSVAASEAKGFGYFDYEPTERFEPKKIIGLLHEASKEVSQVHLLVFPELALTEDDLEHLQSALEETIPVGQIPMIITGIRGRGKEMSVNKVRLSVYFARKWYNLGQEKHHRWKLDSSQIKQYSLSRALNPDNIWWEGMDISPRQLTFLVPNTWLTLCPLICEDLAQLEPISHLIRGVGPNLVIAILMDGPQLPQRWSARYVGVLADDPGSAVLTLTSLGMAVRCSARGLPENRTIALWKGQDSSWEPIDLTGNSKAVLLSICAHSKEEFTADGRSDGGVASSLQLHELHRLEASETVKFERKRISKSVPDDLVDLTAFSYLADAIIDAPGKLITQFRARVTQKDESKEPLPVIDSMKFFESVWSCIQDELRRQRNTAEKEAKGWNKTSFDKTVARLCEFMIPFNNGLDKHLLVRGDSAAQVQQKLRSLQDPVKKLKRWTQISEAAIKGIESLDIGPLPANNSSKKLEQEYEEGRLHQILYTSVLWAIFNRLELQTNSLTNRSAFARRVTDRKADSSPTTKECRRLFDALFVRVKRALA